MINKTNMSKLLILSLLLTILLSLGTISLAERVPIGTNNDVRFEYDNSLPEVTIDEASTWVERKGFELVGFLQTFMQPFAVVIFIGCAILVLLGAFGNGRLVGRGLLGMFISVSIYVVALYAPEIMDIFLGWVMS